jgi:malate/lactate dehydrogenase
MPSVPHLLGAAGVVATLPLSLSDSELNELHASAAQIRAATDALKAVL